MIKIKIDFNSFFRKGVKNIQDDFEISMINGRQGSGKTYYAIYKLETQFKGKKLYTNIRTYKTPNLDVEYFSKVEDIYNNHDIGSVFVIDELSKKYTKDSKIDKQFYSWLQQSRKHKRHVFLITQEYLQVPQWLRGVASTCYTTKPIPLTPFMITSVGFPVLNEDCEWALNETGMIIYKRNKKIASLYDTFELINEL